MLLSVNIKFDLFHNNQSQVTFGPKGAQGITQRDYCIIAREISEGLQHCYCHSSPLSVWGKKGRHTGN